MNLSGERSEPGKQCLRKEALENDNKNALIDTQVQKQRGWRKIGKGKAVTERGPTMGPNDV